MTHFQIAATIVVFGTTLPSGPSGAAKPARPGSSIEIWERGAGPMKGDEAPRARSQRIDLDQLPLVDVEHMDVQYGEMRAIRGVAVKTVIDRFVPDASLDLAILHFANGMAVPIPFRDAAVMKRLDPFIARGMETHRKGPIRIDFFLDIPKKGTATDARPITFSGNKLVVADRWHPALSTKAAESFSPWAHVDSLTSIELVAAASYYHQFDAGGDTTVRHGFDLFQQSCQFCHGARKVGAAFGWDFVEPMPIYSVRKPAKNLFLHVAYKPLDAAERGLMMPAMKFMTETEANWVWQWLHALATKPMPGYTKAPAAAAK